MSPTGVFWILLFVFLTVALFVAWVITFLGTRERQMGQRLAQVRQAGSRAGQARGVRGALPFGSGGLHRAIRRRQESGSGAAEDPGPEPDQSDTVDGGQAAAVSQITAAQAFSSPGAAAPTAQEKKRVSFRELVSDALERPLQAVNLAKGVALDLRKADVKLKVSEFLMMSMGSGFLSFIMGVVATRNVLFGLLALTGGLFAPRWWLENKKAVRARAFDRQLPDALNMISSSLRSGYSLLQAIGVVAREMPAPISDEFSRVIKESQFNIPVEDAMANLAERIESVDLDLAITAMIIQRQVGGNLSEVLDNITTTIRDRIRIMGEIRTLTAQGRVSGWIIALLPVGLATAAYVINPGYIGPLFIHPVGRLILGLAVVMQFLGLFLVRRIVNVQV